MNKIVIILYSLKSLVLPYSYTVKRYVIQAAGRLCAEGQKLKPERVESFPMHERAVEHST